MSVIAGIAILALSCGDGTVEPPPPPPAPVATTVTVSPASATLTALEETARFTAEVRDQNGQVMSGATVAWASSDAEVATVDASGVATAAANGSATITATAGSVSGTAAVTVAQVVNAVAVSPAIDTLVAFGDTVHLVAEATDANGHGVPGVTFVWSSSDTLVVVVSSEGLATAVGNGTATITAAAGSAQGTARITVAAPNYAPPYRGTAFLDSDVIVPSDPTGFVGLAPAGRGERFVYDRRHGWITIQAYLFDATFANGLSAEFQVNPEFGTWTEAETVARAYAPAIGQIPVALREDVDAVWIHRGDEPFGGGNRALTVHTDRGDQYRERGILPEILVHEGVHASLDSAHADAPGWVAAQAADPTFISTYARDYPEREDLAESFSAWLAVRHRSDRITEGMADTITAAIPHRLAYFDSLDLNLCPVTGACEAPVRATLSGTVSHGWADPESGPSVMTPSGRVAGAVIEVVDGRDAGRQATTDDYGRYLLESLEQARLTVRVTADGFAPVVRALHLASDTALAFAISRELPPARPPTPFPDTDPDWLRALSSDYPYAHHVGNVRVFSDISAAFSEEHAEHLSRVWDFFDALYAENRGAYVDAYYTSDSTVFKKIIPHCPTIFIPDARVVTACYLDYPRWFIIPYQIPDLGTQLHEIGHDFAFATWPEIEAYPWFKEGTAMYFESGVFTDANSLTVPTPFSWCTILFQRSDREGGLIPLGQLLRLAKLDFLADNWRTYSQSCMLFDYLERHEPGVLYALINRINVGQIATNEELIAALLELTGQSIGELEAAYEAYARTAGGG